MDADEAWERGKVVEDYDPAIIRKDGFGAWIYRDHHGWQSHFGWTACGGRPFQWMNADAGRDGGPCEITSNGTRNVPVGVPDPYKDRTEY
ncbi:MAG: hypothetical protein MPJ06_02495 [Nitrosopumilus sp.]|nr:hypothetical protein [Nitrosopumilus sp.]MDA7942867.1 hypothetical protein [Nitrosopumilus sp.]MDA7998780.1 hypothetical protein [Nitrosopumilus sp.]